MARRDVDGIAGPCRLPCTNDAVDLVTAIMPLNGSPLPQTLEVDTPAFGAGDWRDLSFTRGVPGRIAVGQSLTLTGRVTARDAVDFSSLTLGFWALNASSAINSNYLFWPNSGSQFPRSSVSTIVVE